MSCYEKTVCVMRLEDRTPTVLPVLMVDCDLCKRPCWIEGDQNDIELIEMRHVCLPCMHDLMKRDPSLRQQQIGHYEPKAKTMPIDPHYADQATTAAAALMKAYRHHEIWPSN